MRIIAAFAAAIVISTTTMAQSPAPLGPTYSPIVGVTAGIAIPLGRLADDHAPGYALGGLAEYAVAGQPYALRGELLYQRFSLKSGRSVGRDVNLTSIGATIVSRTHPAPASTFVLGGIEVFNGTDLGTRPGINGGAGVEIPLTGFSATGEARLHIMFADARPVITLPLTVGLRF